MILTRRLKINIPELAEQYDQLLQNMENDDFKFSLLKFAELMQIYNGAMKEVSTKLEVLDDEFQINQKHNPIHHLECRIKSPKSIFNKLTKLGYTPSLDFAREYVHDIAGVRVICNFLDDIYTVENLLLKQPDVILVEKKDYITHPKENGYRSLHLVVKIPVFLSSKKEEIPVEIQLRTIAMDYWASLEHMLQYKKNGEMQRYREMLLDCANKLAETEEAMQYIRKNIDN